MSDDGNNVDDTHSAKRIRDNASVLATDVPSFDQLDSLALQARLADVDFSYHPAFP